MTQFKYNYEKILKDCVKPMAIADLRDENTCQFGLRLNINILVKAGFMIKSNGYSYSGRIANVYKSTKTKLTNSEYLVVAGMKTAYHAMINERRGILPRSKINAPAVRQKILDVCKDGLNIRDARMASKQRYSNQFYYHFKFLVDNGYLENMDGKNQRNDIYKTVNPDYEVKLDKRPPAPEKVKIEIEIKEPEPIIVKGYVNGVVKVSSNDYHPVRMAKTSPRNYVSGSTLSMAL